MTTQRLTILLVEDNEDHAEIIRRGFLERSPGVDLAHANDGEDALDFLKHRGRWVGLAPVPRPQLILLDLRLPKLDGFGVLRELKATEELRTIPVVILTTSDAEEDVARAYGENANSYLVKPADFDSFVELVGVVDTFWCQWNRAPTSPDAGSLH